ncbi:MAG: hypothetical protein J6I76_12855 [Oribacterium sp.]|nr:hypothetical protein [Oribacterium sp.]
MDTNELRQFIHTCESLETNKDHYLGYIENYKRLLNTSIYSHNLEDFELFTDEYFNLNSKLEDHLLTSEFLKINQIKFALLNEKTYAFPLFWDDVYAYDELIRKYNKTVLMLRRLLFDLPDIFKDQTYDFLACISPFIIKAAYDDPTNILGMEKHIYVILAKECLIRQKYNHSSLYLELAKRV